MPDIPSIRSLVLASSAYYQTYARVRSQILFGLLCRHYNDEVEITESLVALRSEGLIAEDRRNRDKIIDLLDIRRRGGCSREQSKKKKYKHDSFTIPEIIKLLKLHEAGVYFMEDFAASVSQPPWWRPATQGQWEDVHLKLSHTERARFFRAYYRLQTWCQIFGQPEYHPLLSPSHRAEEEIGRPCENEWADRTFTHEEAWRFIWGTMPPWEVEEIGCLLEYFMFKYIQIFQEITSGLSHGNKPGGSGSSSSVDAAGFSSSRGPVPLRRPLQDIYELRGILTLLLLLLLDTSS